jgi:hypothetical protein
MTNQESWSQALAENNFAHIEAICDQSEELDLQMIHRGECVFPLLGRWFIQRRDALAQNAGKNSSRSCSFCQGNSVGDFVAAE